MYYMRTRGLIVALLLVVLLPTGTSLAVSVVPGSIDFGTVEPGQTLTVTYYLTTNQNDPFEVTAEFRGSYDSQQFNSDFPADQVSEEPIENWIRFQQDAVVVDPSDPTYAILRDGSNVTAHAALEVFIEIPEDAEPGYHVGTIRPSPQTGTGSGYGAQTRGVTQAQFSFRVEGAARRSIDIGSVRAYRSAEDQAYIDMMVENTGTVTTTVRRSDFAVVDEVGRDMTQIDISNKRIAPGERELVRSIWRADDLEGGEYELRGELDYRTGMVSVSESFSLSDTVQAIPSVDEAAQGDEPIPLWLIIMALVLLGVLMYAFEIKPVYIFGTIGFLGASAVILLFPISNLLIILPLIMVGVLVYYV